MYQTPSPLLLSRVAESAYWAGRYLERAEGTARLVRSHSDLVIDLPHTARIGWRPLLDVLDAELDVGDEPTEETVVEYLCADTTNPNSIRSSVAAAHSNLRVARAVIPVDATEVFNELRDHVDATASGAVDRRVRGDWLRRVSRACRTLVAVLGDSMSHDDAYCFFTVGRQLERADFTTGVLDVQNEVFFRKMTGPVEPYLDICWFAALRSLDTLQPFRRSGAPNSADATIAFLLSDTKCPRTLESTLIEASRWLLEIPGHAAAMSAIAATQSRLQDVDVSVLVDGSLHEFVDDLQVSLADIHREIETSWLVPDRARRGQLTRPSTADGPARCGRRSAGPRSSSP